MNWLIYIGGGWIWLWLWDSVIHGAIKFVRGSSSTKVDRLIGLLASLASWIWICYRIATVFGDLMPLRRGI